MLKSGENPRHVLPRHEERSSNEHVFTLRVLAEAAGVTYQTVRAAITRGRLELPKKPKGEAANYLSAEALRSIAGYIQRALQHKSKPIHNAEARGTLPSRQQDWWDNRWPSFVLYRCAHPDCDELLFGPGVCAEHGGERRPLIKLDPDGHIVVLLGRDYVPLHRVVAQTPPGQHTHHRDGNPWNNRWDNLECLDPREHEDRHIGGVLSARVKKRQPQRKPLRSELGGMTKAELQEKIDEAYLQGLEEGERRARA